MMLFKWFNGPTDTARAFAGTMLNPGGLWQTTGGGDAVYALDERGVYRIVDHVDHVKHGVIVQWNGMNVAERFSVSWCECHADHPVIKAAVTQGRFLQCGTSEAERLRFTAWQAEQGRLLRRSELLRELARLKAADEQSARDLAEQLPAAERRTAAAVSAQHRRGVASARRHVNSHGTTV